MKVLETWTRWSIVKQLPMAALWVCWLDCEMWDSAVPKASALDIHRRQRDHFGLQRGWLTFRCALTEFDRPDFLVGRPGPPFIVIELHILDSGENEPADNLSSLDSQIAPESWPTVSTGSWLEGSGAQSLRRGHDTRHGRTNPVATGNLRKLRVSAKQQTGRSHLGPSEPTPVWKMAR